MTPEERARKRCGEHIERYPSKSNVPLQSVYEWLVTVQREAIAEEREACALAICSRCRAGLPLIEVPEALHDRLRHDLPSPRPTFGGEITWAPCAAAAIRARA